MSNTMTLNIDTTDNQITQFSDVLNKNAAASLSTSGKTRYFNGIISSVSLNKSS